jgi:hypothetical protein
VRRFRAGGIHKGSCFAETELIGRARIEHEEPDLVGRAFGFEALPRFSGGEVHARGVDGLGVGKASFGRDFGIVAVHDEDPGNEPPGEEQAECNAGPAVREEGESFE